MKPTLHQRIYLLRRWIATGDPQLEPEWDDTDLANMAVYGLSPAEYAIERIESLESVDTYGDR